MEKTFFLPPLLFLLFLVLLFPNFVLGEGLIDQSKAPYGFSSLDDLKKLPCDIVEFLKKNIVVPALILFLTIGGLLIIVSGADPNLYSLGKYVLICTIIGAFLVYGAGAIVNMIAGEGGCPGQSGTGTMQSQ